MRNNAHVCTCSYLALPAVILSLSTAYITEFFFVSNAVLQRAHIHYFNYYNLFKDDGAAAAGAAPLFVPIILTSWYVLCSRACSVAHTSTLQSGALY